MGEIRVGDNVVGSDGLPAIVQGVFPRRIQPLYEVKFNDGSSTICDREHIWTVCQKKKSGEDFWVNKNTEELLLGGLKYGKNNSRKWKIPMVSPVEFGKKSLPIHPYILGVLLGDGSLVHGGATWDCPDVFIARKVDELCPEKCHVICKEREDRCDRWTITAENIRKNPILIALDELGLRGLKSQEKFVPSDYLWSSVEDRLNLLQGLMDTDGSFSTVVEFSSASRNLSESVKHLVESLGGTAVFAVKENPAYEHKGQKKTGLPSYRVTIRLPRSINPFSLPRKSSAFLEKEQHTCVARRIDSIEQVKSGESICIKVDREDGLFVAKDFVVTHNTLLSCAVMNEAKAKGKKSIFLASGRQLIFQKSKKLSDCQTVHSVMMSNSSGHIGGAYAHQHNGSTMTDPILVASKDTLRSKAKNGHLDRIQADVILVDECVDGESLVETIRGQVPVKDIVPGDLCLSFSGESLRYSPVVAKKYSGHKKTLVIHAGGRKIKCTHNHPIMTQRGWIHAGKVLTSDKILLLADVVEDRKADITKRKTSQKKFQHSGNLLNHACVDVVQLQTLNDSGALSNGILQPVDQGQFQGISEGTSVELLEQTPPCPENKNQQLSGLSTETRALRSLTKKVLRPGFLRITHLNKRSGCPISANSFRISNQKSRSLTIQGMGNSCVDTQQSVLNRSSRSTRLLDRTEGLKLQKLGSKCLGKSGLRGGSATMDPEDIKPCICTQTLSQKMSVKLQRSTSKKITEKQESASRENTSTYLSARKLGWKFTREPSSTFPSVCGTRWVDVSRIEESGKSDVYDIEIQDDHNFFANGILVHNCHLATSAEWLSLFRQSPGSVFIGLSATPALGNGKPLPFWKEIVLGATHRELIEAGFLMPPKVFAPYVVDTQGIRKQSNGEYSLPQLAEKFNQEKLVGDAVVNWKKYGENRPTFVYGTSVEHAIALSREFRNSGISADYIEANTPQNERQELFDNFNLGKLKVLCNFGILRCLDMETEILTSSGWKSFGQLSGIDKVANWEPGGGIFFKKPKMVFRRKRQPGERMVSVSGLRLNMRVTEGHEMVYSHYRSGDKWGKKPAIELAGKRYIFPVCGNSDPFEFMVQQESLTAEQYSRKIISVSHGLRARNSMGLEESKAEAKKRIDQRYSLRRLNPNELNIDECRFIGFWCGDGSRGKSTGGGEIFRISQSSRYMEIVKWIEGVLERCNFNAAKHTKPMNGEFEAYEWLLSKGTGRGPQAKPGIYRIIPYLEKDGSELLWGLNHEQFDAFLEGLHLSDGEHYTSTEIPDSLRIPSTNHKFLSTVQAIAVCRGYQAKIATEHKRNPKHNDMHRLFLSRKRNRFFMGNDTLQIENDWKEEDVWCVKTDSGNIITRRNGKVAVMGNCGTDIPKVSCIQLMTKMGSLNSYLQTVGRGARPHPESGKEDFVVIDHGGNVHAHGWMQDDSREWSLDPKEPGVSTPKPKEDKPDDKIEKTICCPKCCAMRPASAGGVCLNCGHRHQRTGLKVRTADGRLREITETEARKSAEKSDEQKLWLQKLAIAANAKRGSLPYSAAAKMFYNDTGKWPEESKVGPIVDGYKRDQLVATLWPNFVRRRR